MRPITILIVLAGLLAAGCGSSTGGGSTVGGGTSSGATGIAGLVQSFHSSDRSSLSPLPDAKVGVYRKAFAVVGPPQANEPSPIATSATDAAGKFEIDGLKPGRYFVVAASASRWVEVADGQVSTTKFAVCGDCAVPL